MATYKVRGNAHNVIYPYKTPDGAKKQQWETYETELEAVQRKGLHRLLTEKQKCG